MPQYVSRLQKMGVPRWARGLAILFLAAALVGNLALYTLSTMREGGGRHSVSIALLWLLCIIGLVMLVRLWRATVMPGSSPPRT